MTVRELIIKLNDIAPGQKSPLLELETLQALAKLLFLILESTDINPDFDLDELP